MRSGSLDRRTALKSGKPPKRRRPMAEVGRRGLAQLPARLACVAAVKRRDRTCKGGDRIRELIPGWRCGGRLEVHEPLTRARGGDPTDPAQCLLLCAACHSWAHREPVLAAEIGLLRHSWDQPKGDKCKSST